MADCTHAVKSPAADDGCVARRRWLNAGCPAPADALRVAAADVDNQQVAGAPKP